MIGVGAGLSRLLFTAAIFVGSFLLFLVQPMIARMALPRLGGAPAVWNSAMLVYQALLLGGYAYADAIGRLVPRQQAMVHLALLVLACLALPIGLANAVPPVGANPFLWVPGLLLVSIGPLFFVVASQAPLIQRWYALTSSNDPYNLYAASNLGSFVGLISYPLLLEPMTSIGQQQLFWSAGYIVLLGLMIGCATFLRDQAAGANRVIERTRVPVQTFSGWVALAAIPSGLILSTTLHLTTDVVAMPLLWVLPLGVYLLSFTVAFAANRSVAEAISKVAPFVLLVTVCLLPLTKNGTPLFLAGISVLNLFTVSVALHSELFTRRPPSENLTTFYLAMAVGGLVGGIFCALLAPLIFNWTYEHLLLLVGAAAFMTAHNPFDRYVRLWDRSKLARQVTGTGIVFIAGLSIITRTSLGPQVTSVVILGMIAIAIFAIGNRVLFATVIAALILTTVALDRISLSLTPGKLTRSYFGVYALETGTGNSRTLVHGTTLHGAQNRGSPAIEREPTTYYVPESGVGLALTAAPRLFGKSARIDVVGLGAGTVACYALPGQSWTFYEIDPAVAAIAQDPAKFTFLSRCLPNADIRLGDARLSLSSAPAAGADILIIDAFSSDSIPMHLLTREAFAAYRRRLGTNGLLLVHISNRHLDLEPILAGTAANQGWETRVREFRATAQDMNANRLTSVWIALSPKAVILDNLVSHSGQKWRRLVEKGAIRWTDDRGSLLPLLRWKS